VILIAAIVAAALTVQGSVPPARGHFGLAFDEKQGKTVLAGGAAFKNGAMVQYDDYWAWDGHKWTSAGATGVQIMGHRLVYDSKAGRVQMFGGILGAGQPCGDLRVWVREQWITLSSTPEMAAADPGLAFDSSRGVLVAFLTDEKTGKSATWEWDGKAWKQTSREGPVGRVFASMTYDRLHAKVLLFGGTTGDNHFETDTWQYADGKWARLDVTGPTGRRAPGLAFDDKLGLVILHGGMLSSFNWAADTWSWDGKAWTKLSENGPDLEGSMVYDKTRDRMVVVGGRTHENPGEGMETWEWDGKSWSKATNP
jgi:hypothetical protein